MNYGHEITETGGNAGFGIPGIDEGSSLSFGNECPGAFEAIQLALDGFKGNFKISRYRPAIRFAVMKGVKEHRLGGSASEKILKSGAEHEPYIGSYDP